MEIALVDRAIPRGAREAGCLEGDDAVVGASPVVEVVESHTCEWARRSTKRNSPGGVQFSAE
jgi:hypothetical protein